MKCLLILLFTFTSMASAKTCIVTNEITQDGEYNVRCSSTGIPDLGGFKGFCLVPSADIYRVDQIDGKYVCTINADKKQAKEDAKAAAEAAQSASERERKNRRDTARTVCANQPDASPLKALCEAALDEDL